MTAKQTDEKINCPACGKEIKKVKRYYRNQKFYCNKKCWRKSIASKEESQKT